MSNSEKRPFWKGPARSPAQVRDMAKARETRMKQIMGSTPMNLQSSGTLGDLSSVPLACLPSTIPALNNRRLPLSQTEFSETFANDFTLIPENAGQQSTGLVSKLVGGGSPVAPFFLRSACLVVRVDPAAFTLTGAAVARPTAPATAPPRVPRVVPTTGLPDDATALPAILEYNHQALQGFTDLLMSYQFQYLLQGRFMMINERANDVGTIDSNSCYKGFGTAQADPSLMVRLANQHWTESGADQIFVPSNCTTADADGVALEPPTVDIQYATPYAPGVFGVCYPVKPHVLFPGMYYQFLLNRIPDDDYYYNRLQQRWTFTDGIRKPDDNFADSVAADADGPAIWIGSVPFAYGTLQFGVILRGAEVMPEEALQWMLMFGQPYMSLMGNDRNLWSQVDQLARQCGLSGLPAPLGRFDADPRWQKAEAIRALFTERRSNDGSLAGFDMNTDRPMQKDELRDILKHFDQVARPQDFGGQAL